MIGRLWRYLRATYRDAVRRALDAIAIPGDLDRDAYDEARGIARSTPDFDLVSVYQAILRMREADLEPWNRAATVILAHRSNASLAEMVRVAIASHRRHQGRSGTPPGPLQGDPHGPN